MTGPAVPDRPTRREVVRRGDGYSVELWEVSGIGGDRLPIEVTVPAGRVTGSVVVAHGAGAAGDAPYVRPLARGLARAGLVAAAPDAPGHGRRARAVGAPPPALTTGVVEQAAGDLGVAAAFLDRTWAPPTLSFAGFSMGVLTGVPFLAAHGRVESAALVVGGSTGDPATDPACRAPLVVSTRVLMVQAEADEVFDRRSALALYDAFTCPKRMVVVPGSHDRWEHPAALYRLIVDHLRGAVAPGP